MVDALFKIIVPERQQPESLIGLIIFWIFEEYLQVFFNRIILIPLPGIDTGDPDLSIFIFRLYNENFFEYLQGLLIPPIPGEIISKLLCGIEIGGVLGNDIPLFLDPGIVFTAKRRRQVTGNK